MRWVARFVGTREPLTGHRAAMAWTGLVLGVATVPAAALPQLGVPVRFAILLAFVSFGPGAAFVSLIRLGDAVSSWAMALVLSLGLAGVIADVMLWTNLWSAVGGYAVLAVPTAATAIVALLPGWRQRAGTGPPPVAEPPRPSRDHGATALLPQVPTRGGQPLPRPGTDSTMLLPQVREGRLPRHRRGLDETILLPMARINDATALLPTVSPKVSPAVSPARRPDETAVIRVPVARRPPPDEVLMGVLAASDVPEETGPATGTRRGLLLEAGIAAAILAIWLFGVSRTSTASVGDYGLLSVAHPALFVAVALCVLRFTVEMAREHWRGWVLVVQVVALVLIMHATTPLLTYDPEYFWTYRHIGIVEGFRAFGQITDSYDIYQLWPTFFAFAAHLIDASGIGALRVAAWAPVFFDLIYCLPIFAIARTLAKDRRIPYLTVFLFQVVNWVAQDYFAPQAFTYVLCLGTLLIMLRWLRRTADTKADRTPRRIAALWAWAGNGLAEVPYTSKTARRAAMAVLYILYAAVVASHQLSPYLIAMSAGALVVLGLIRPLRLVPILISIAILYLLPRYEAIEGYGLFNGFNFFSNAQTNSPVAGASAGRVFSGQVAQFLSLTVWGLAALTVVASRRRLGPVAAPAVLAFTPFGLLLAQSYGGEALFRVYFFSIPWCAYLIATLVLRTRWLPRGLAVPGAALLLTAFIAGNLQARHGSLSFNQYTRAEVAASEYIYTHAEPDAEIMLAANAFPNRYTANSNSFAPGRTGARELLGGDDNELATLRLNELDLPTINAYFEPTRPTYLVFGPAMGKYLHYFGYAPDGLFETLRSTIDRSRNWRLFYLDGDVAIYAYVP